MQIDILTLFPKMFEGPFNESILRRAQDKLLVKINLHNLRTWTVDTYGSVDDRPYGGGAGMVIRVDVVDKALRALKIKDLLQRRILLGRKRSKIKNIDQKSKIILLTPQGKVFTQEKARELSKLDRVVLICGHYEGFDERIREYLVDEELSIGEYVLTGGELPAMVVTDAMVRIIPGVLLKQEATMFESFGEFPLVNIKYQISPKYTSLAPEASSLALARSVTSGQAKIKDKTKNLKTKTNNIINSQSGIRNPQLKVLEYPQYTRPEIFNGWKVPVVLMSGNHKEIEKWRRSKIKTKQ